jgi:prepilin-type N-terminal cleavage/methylation domain-containing protein
VNSGRLFRERGVTLIELLAAMALSGLVVALASRIFLSGHAQFLRRSADSEKMALFYRLKAEVESNLKGEIISCTGGHLVFRSDSGEADLGAKLRKRHPDLAQSRFQCMEPDPEGTALQDWKEGAKPPLIEYRLDIRFHRSMDSLTGSWSR